MNKQTLTQDELLAMAAAMDNADFGPEIEIEIVGEATAAAEEFYCEDDGQPSEYDEWQDFNGGDDWDHGQYDDCYDGGVDV
jgi:hypothetical protein